MNDINFQFAMYNPITDTVEVNIGAGTVLFIHCKNYNSTVMFDNPNDIVYLYYLAKEQPLTYAKFALSGTGLQDYVDAMNWFNY
ncbi:DUF6061 family protein [Anaerocolumna jejuensis]|uniref:DUF6061 family protein n=1 Tax=Anaerocolumna jejuensis TaxID=259063 RepID=UPI003F7B3E76